MKSKFSIEDLKIRLSRENPSPNSNNSCFTPFLYRVSNSTINLQNLGSTSSLAAPTQTPVSPRKSNQIIFDATERALENLLSEKESRSQRLKELSDKVPIGICQEQEPEPDDQKNQSPSKKMKKVTRQEAELHRRNKLRKANYVAPDHTRLHNLVRESIRQREEREREVSQESARTLKPSAEELLPKIPDRSPTNTNILAPASPSTPKTLDPPSTRNLNNTNNNNNDTLTNISKTVELRTNPENTNQPNEMSSNASTKYQVEISSKRPLTVISSSLKGDKILSTEVVEMTAEKPINTQKTNATNEKKSITTKSSLEKKEKLTPLLPQKKNPVSIDAARLQKIQEKLERAKVRKEQAEKLLRLRKIKQLSSVLNGKIAVLDKDCPYRRFIDPLESQDNDEIHSQKTVTRPNSTIKNVTDSEPIIVSGSGISGLISQFDSESSEPILPTQNTNTPLKRKLDQNNANYDEYYRKNKQKELEKKLEDKILEKLYQKLSRNKNEVDFKELYLRPSSQNISSPSHNPVMISDERPAYQTWRPTSNNSSNFQNNQNSNNSSKNSSTNRLNVVKMDLCENEGKLVTRIRYSSEIQYPDPNHQLYNKARSMENLDQLGELASSNNKVRFGQINQNLFSQTSEMNRSSSMNRLNKLQTIKNLNKNQQVGLTSAF